MRREVPKSPEAEEALLGAIVWTHGRAVALVRDLVEPEDFYDGARRAIYEAALELDRAGKPADILMLSEYIRSGPRAGALASAGGEGYLAEISGRVATIENLGHYAGLVRSAAEKRALIEKAARMIERAYGGADGAEVLEEAQQELFAIASRRGRQGYQHVKPLLHAHIKTLEHRYQNRGQLIGIPTGFTEFDKKTKGLQPAKYIVVAGRPGSGKTSFLLNTGTHAAIQHGFPVLIFSLEMDKESLLDRMISGESGVAHDVLITGEERAPDWLRVSRAAASISGAPIYIDDEAKTLTEIRMRARRWRSDPRIFPPDGPKWGLIVVDYLQLVKVPPKKGAQSSRIQDVTDISQGLNDLKKELRCPIVALSQLNRECENRPDGRPQCSDLSQSGQIEADADLIVLIHRPDRFHKEPPENWKEDRRRAELERQEQEKGIAEVIIGKQRNGETGTVRLLYQGEYMRFRSLSRREEGQ